MSAHNCANKRRSGDPPRFSLFAVVTLAAALLGAGAAEGAATYSTADGGSTLVVTVDAAGAELSASQVASGITKIRKEGPGTLTAVRLPSFSGDFDIVSGVYKCVSSVAGDFGSTNAPPGACAIYVRDGASIEYAGSGSKPGTMSGKVVHLYGSAASGASGKIYLSTSVQMGAPGFGKDVSVKLHGNASFWSRSRLCLTGTFDLGGNVLELCGGSGRSFDIGGVVTNGGHVAIASGTTWMTQSAGVTFAADCASGAYVLVEQGATFNIKDKRCYANGWTVRNNGGSLTCNTQRAPTTVAIGVWEGPVVLSGEAKMANYGAAIGAWNISNTVLNINGPLSGSGSLAAGPGWLNLHHAENSYAGSVTVRGKGTKRTAAANENVVPPGAGGIGVWNGASVFMNASSVTLKDSAGLGFMDSSAPRVCALKFVGDVSEFTDGDPGDDTQSIKGGSSAARPTIAAIEKTGSNVLLVDSPVRVTGRTAIGEGTLRIARISAVGQPGLHETHVTQKNAPADQKYIYDNGSAYGFCKPWESSYRSHVNLEEKGVNPLGPERASIEWLNGRSGWGDGLADNVRNGWWYSGYVWNHSNAPVTWKVWSGFVSGGVCVWLGESHERMYEFDHNDAAPHYKVARAVEMTLQPGATRIDIFIYASRDRVWCREIPNSSVRFGLSYAAEETGWTVSDFNAEIARFYSEPSPAQTNVVKDMAAQFKAFSDGGKGHLFTANNVDESDVSRMMEGQPVFDDLVFAPGASLDLSCNYAYQARNLTGSPRVLNAGVFRIAGNWTIRASDFPAGNASAHLPMSVDGRLDFAAGSSFSVDDAYAVDWEGTVVATATAGITGSPAPAPGLSGWCLSAEGDRLVLRHVPHSILIFR